MSGTYLKTGSELDSLVPRIRGFLAADTLDVTIDGQAIRGYRSPDARSIWIRDYSDMLRGVRHFEPDVKSVVDHFGATQATNGRIFDYFTTVPEKPGERENWTRYVRVPVEADVEFRFVKAAWLAYQACGDHEWIEGLLPGLERALEYTFGHPWRWDEELELVKRAYTIDTWDFAYTAGRHEWLQFQVDENTFWGVMHGDVSGTFEACRIVAALHRDAGREQEARFWDERARQLRLRLDEHAWNGRFYTHFVKRTPVSIEGVDEAEQLSLSNPMNINRAITSQEQAVAILREYQGRGRRSDAFAEWFSIDPPFPDGVFGDGKLVAGSYCNGGIMPLVGGELARAAFEHGFERYGVEILRRYDELTAESGATYLWYHPDGTPSSLETSTSPEATPTDGWGSSAMLYALIEGLAGVVDRWVGYERVTIAPRWFAAGIDEAEVQVGYAASGRGIGYGLRLRADSISMELWSPGAEVELRLLLPEGTVAKEVRVAGELVPFVHRMVEASRYLDASFSVETGVDVRITLTGVEEAL